MLLVTGQAREQVELGFLDIAFDDQQVADGAGLQFDLLDDVRIQRRPGIRWGRVQLLIDNRTLAQKLLRPCQEPGQIPVFGGNLLLEAVHAS